MFAGQGFKLTPLLGRNPGRRPAAGQILHRGIPESLPADEAALLGDQVFITDPAGEIVNQTAENSCACYVAPEDPPAAPRTDQAKRAVPAGLKHTAGCMVCGSGLKDIAAASRAVPTPEPVAATIEAVEERILSS